MILAYSVPQLIAFLTNLILSLFVLRSNRQKIHFVYCLFSICVCIWTVCAFALFYDLSFVQALWVGRILHVGVLFIPALFFHFICLLLAPPKAKYFVLPIYAVAFTFFILNVSGYLIVSVKKSYFGYYSVGGPLYRFFSLYVASVILSSLILILKTMRNASRERKDQLRFLSFGTSLALIGGVSDLLPVIGLQHYPFTNIPFYRLGSLTIGIYGVCVAYSIIRHRLMEIEVIIRKTLIFAGLVAFVFGVFTAATFLVREVLSRYIGMSDTWAYAISIFLIVLGYDPIRSLLINLTDRFLFQKKYDYQKLLRDATKGIAAIESLDHLLRLVVHFITMRIRVQNAAVLTRQQKTGSFKLGYERGYEKRYIDYGLSADHPLIQYLTHEKEAIEIEHVKEYLETGSKKKVRGRQPRPYDFAAIRQQMEQLGAACCVPSFLGQELRNILVLGEKKAGAYYTEEDLNLLFTLAQESAIAIENARLYDEAINKNRELQRINRQLEFAKTRLTGALQETEAANKQLQDTQAQLIHEQKMATLGRLAASVGHEVNNPLTILSMNVSRAILKYRKNPDLKVSEIMEVFQKMEQNISRIKAVVNTLTGLLKKSEKGKFEPLSLKLILEETLPLVQFQTYLDNLVNPDVEFEVPGSIPLVRGDLERLQEVFLNLFINAYHAMAGRMNPHIGIRAELDSGDSHMVAIHFTDNGHGMAEETMKKIFNYGYTTKPPGRGSGMGLYMCKYIIELHGGTIRVDSKLGQGTTFTLTLPVYEEASMTGTSSEQATGS